MSQPSLSVQIAELERGLGITIFERDRHRVSLTAMGRDFVESARAVLQAANTLMETARRCIDPFSGTLRIGVIPTISPYWLPELTRALHNTYPKLTIIWVEDKTHALIHAIQSSAIDAALLALEAEIRDVEREAIAKDRSSWWRPREIRSWRNADRPKLPNCAEQPSWCSRTSIASASRRWSSVCARKRNSISSAERVSPPSSAWSRAAQE